MSDYTLSDGNMITVSSGTTVENFVYEGGTIRVTPNTYYYKTGDFIFNPTSSEDPERKIFNSFISRFALECGANGKMAGLKIYDLYPETALFFPCILFQYMGNDEPSVYLFDNYDLMGLNISMELAFKRDYRVQMDNTIIGGKDLAEHYLFNANEIVNDILYRSDFVKVGDITITPKIREPKEPNQTLYGFSMDLYVEYMTS